jgi:hypothetical protein
VILSPAVCREVPIQDDQIRAALVAHWEASPGGDVDAEHDIYADDAICDYPQSGERIHWRRNLQSLRAHHPGRPSGFQVKRILGGGVLLPVPQSTVKPARGGRPSGGTLLCDGFDFPQEPCLHV